MNGQRDLKRAAENASSPACRQGNGFSDNRKQLGLATTARPRWPQKFAPPASAGWPPIPRGIKQVLKLSKEAPDGVIFGCRWIPFSSWPRSSRKILRTSTFWRTRGTFIPTIRNFSRRCGGPSRLAVCRCGRCFLASRCLHRSASIPSSGRSCKAVRRVRPRAAAFRRRGPARPLHGSRSPAIPDCWQSVFRQAPALAVRFSNRLAPHAFAPS